MTTRTLSLFLPRLPTDRIRRGGPRPSWPCAAPGLGEPRSPAEPLVTVETVRGARRLAAVDAAATARGLRPGLALADARALCPGVAVVEADPRADAALLEAVVGWCRRFTPFAADDGPDGALLDIGGSAHLWGGEAGLAEAALAGLDRRGLAAHAAVASTPGAAWAFARFGVERIVPRPSDPAFGPLAAALPMAALRLDAGTVEGLARLGLARVGDLLGHPRAPLAARFGAGLLARLDAVMGRATPIDPRFTPPPPSAERRFAAGIARAEGIEAALLGLCGRLCAELSRRGAGARRVEARFVRVDGAVRRLAVGTGRPTRAPEVIFALFRERLAALGEDGLDTGYGFDLIRLVAFATEPLDDRQEPLLGGASPGDRSAELADRLAARLGFGRVLRLAARDAHLPECAVATLPAVGSPAVGRPAPEGADDPALCRPARLFERPEPVETVAAVPDGPPVRFRWRQAVHEVAAVEGPERIAPPWWTGGGALTRDYFRAEDRDGRRYWLFREGLFGRETDRPRWFLHGLFG